MAFGNSSWGPPTGQFTLDMLRNGVRQTESSGNYRALGPVTKNGDRAYGAFQVMGSNIPNWTLKALGYPMTKEQFLADDKAQEAVFNHQFGGYLQKYGNPQDAVSAWFTGRPVAQAGNASDGYNNNGQYINKVFKNAGMPAVGQDPRSFQATGSDDMAGPTPAQPDASGTMDLPNNEQTNWGGIGSSLTNLGSIVAGLDKSIGGQLMARNLSNVASNQLREQALNQKDDTPQLLGYNADKSMAMMRRGNQVYSIATPSGFAGKEQPEALKLIDALASDPVRMKAYKDAHGIEDPTEVDPDSLKIAGTDYLINGNDSALRAIPQKMRPEAIRLAREQYEKDTGEKFDATDLAIRRGDYKTLQAESAKFGQMLAPTQAAHDRLQQDISIAKERIAAIPEQLNKASLPWNQFMQLSSKTLQDKGFSELAKAREAIYNVERGYTNVQANGMRSGDTVTAQNRAESLINSAMTPDTLLGEVGKDGKRSGGLLDFMG